MWIVRIALDRPYTFLVLALTILLVSPLVILRTSTDVFPEINIPVVSVIWNYGGLAPLEMERRIVSNYERFLTTTVNDIEHIESQSLQGIALVKIFFQPGADLDLGLSQVTAISQTLLRQLPPGTQPPLVIVYSASTVPVVQLGLSSRTMAEQELFDVGTNFIRNRLATVRGAALPAPYGGRMRMVAVDIDTQALHARGLSPIDVINGINAQNLVLPTGTAKLGDREYPVSTNASPDTIAALGDLPLATLNGAIVRVKDVANVHDGFGPQTNVVRQDGRRGALLTVLKTGGNSTLDIVARVRELVPQVVASVPGELDVRPLFDQSVFVRAAVEGVVREAVVAACLTALLILLFLGTWRSTLIISVSIPLSILASICVLAAIGQTINLMTLGGLALAVGILVDDATVAIENIERHLAMGDPLREAILEGSRQIALPAFVSTLCICIVLAPMFLLTGVARYLFVPLAEAVVFAMIASYILSRTLVPTLAMYLLRAGETHAASPLRTVHERFVAGFEVLRSAYQDVLGSCLRHPRRIVGGFLVVCVLSAAVVPFLGTDFFPSVDAGQIRLHLRGPTGLRIEETVRLCDEVEAYIRTVIPPGDLDTILDNVGVPYSGINLSYSNAGTIGTSDAEILVALRADRRGTTAGYVRRLRDELPRRFPGNAFYFQPASIVNQILNFGVPAPIDVQVVGPDRDAGYRLAQRIANRLRRIPGAVDVHVQQALDLPSLRLDIDRNKAQSMGLTARDVAQTLLIGLSSSGQVLPAFWVNPKNGVAYGLSVQWPQYEAGSLADVQSLPVMAPGATAPQVLANLATTSIEAVPAVVSHYDMQPLMDVYASVQDRDLGSVATEVRKAMDEFRPELPKGGQLVLRGQVAAMTSSFAGLTRGLLVAVVLVYLLLVVNFQSWRDPFIIVTALPGAMAGIAWTLFATGTTINVPSLTGAIMCVGVATANSVLVVSFARERLAAGVAPAEAALEAGFVRMRPVIMTATAMIVGMLPLALGLGEGGEQNAPLGRAVIGGLAVATVATLFVVPTVFASMYARRPPRPIPGAP